MRVSTRQMDLQLRGSRVVAAVRGTAILTSLVVAFAAAGCSRWPMLSPGSAASRDPQLDPSVAAPDRTASSLRPAGPSGSTLERDEKLIRALSGEAATTGQTKIDAIRAWEQGGQTALPVELSQLARDPNSRVRAAALEAAARRRPPEADEIVAAGLQDPEIQVRLAAIAATGTLGGAQASKMLEPLLNDRGESVRAAAARALIRLGDKQILVRAQKDTSWRVRLVAAEALAQCPDATGAQVARQLILDPSVEVQVAVVQSSAQWPLPQAGPMLLAAMASNARTTRQAAAGQLAARWPAAAGFAIDETPSQRAAALVRLQATFRGQFPEDRGTAASSPASPDHPVKAEEVAEAERCIAQLASAASTRAREQAANRLAALGPGLANVLEVVVTRSATPLPDVVYQDVLPQCVLVFAPLARLRSGDLATRRRAAAELATLNERQPLDGLALERFSTVVAKEPDPVVWHTAFKVIAEDVREPSVRLAYAGMRHREPEVRRLASTYLGNHPSPKHVAVLIPALKDPHPEVVRQAIRALGTGGGLEERESLQQMLGVSSETLRVEAATALARLGDPAGPPALERLAHSRDQTVRRQAAAAMGQVPNPVYRATLTGLLNDQSSVRLAAAESLARIAGPEVSASQGAHQGTGDGTTGWKKAEH